jgi:predicted metal-dependent phosphoesterase TrpH
MWFRGDCHVHTDRSRAGELTPEQVAAAAREFGLDFMAITEHNTADTHGAFGSAGLLVIPGQEATTLTGHWVALGLTPGEVVDWQYGVRDGVIDRQLSQVHRGGGLCMAAHPHAPYPSGTFMYPFEGFDLVEVWNGQWSSDLPWNADNETALKEWSRTLATASPWRPAIGNSDTHLAGQIGVPHTVVSADALSTAAILDGLRSGRSWMTDSASVWLSFTASTGASRAGLGERLEAGSGPVTIRLTLDGLAEGTVSFHTERGLAHRVPVGGDLEWQTSAGEAGFVRAEVRHPDGRMAALTNPVFLEA